MRLGTQPIADVVVDLSVSDATEASIDVPQITFTAGNWDQPQTLTVTGLDDVIDDGDIDLSVVASMNVLTADPLYAAMGPEYFAAPSPDNDQRAPSTGQEGKNINWLGLCEHSSNVNAS